MKDQPGVAAAHRGGMTDARETASSPGQILLRLARESTGRELQGILDAAGTGGIDAHWLKDRFQRSFPDIELNVAQGEDADHLAQTLDELPWFADALAKAETDIANIPESAQPRWYRQCIAAAEQAKDTAHG